MSEHHLHLVDEDGQPLILRGCAIPYRRWITADGRREAFEYGAFASHHRTHFRGISLQVYHADRVAQLAEGAIDAEFYDDVMGLTFEAVIRAEAEALVLLQLAHAGGLGCSIQFCDEQRKSNGLVTRARLQHVGLTAYGDSAYPTAAWLEDSSLRYRLRERLTPEALGWRRIIERHRRRAAAA